MDDATLLHWFPWLVGSLGGMKPQPLMEAGGFEPPVVQMKPVARP